MIDPFQSSPSFELDDHAHELVFSCHKRLPLLEGERACRWLAEAIEQCRTELGFHLWAYVFMPEHVHLMVWLRDPRIPVASLLYGIKQPVARRAMRHYERVATEWLPHLTILLGEGRIERRFWLETGGHQRLLAAPAKIHAVIDEIHQNPVRRGLVKEPTDWKWSSASWYAGDRTGKLAIDDASVPRV